MMRINRRMFIRLSVVGVGIAAIYPTEIVFAGGCGEQHPIMPPAMKLIGQCMNCGMQRPMWARTWHRFELAGQPREVCSIHCLAEMSLNSGIEAENVMVADYLNPERLLEINHATYVLGSRARGTMTITSKLAFSSKKAADEFVEKCGGKVTSFEGAKSFALQDIATDNQMIARNRVKKGKIVEPVAGKEKCPVCGMEVAKYPHNKCQIQTKEGTTVHFCATQCLFEFYQNHQKYGVDELNIQFVWVVDYDSHQWVYGQNCYFAVGTSRKGPMGKEAFPFVNRGKAKKFVAQYGGKVVTFENVDIQQILL